MKSTYILFISGLLILQACGGIKRTEKKPQLTTSPVNIQLVVSQKTDPYTIDIDYTLNIPRKYISSCAQLTYSPYIATADHKYELKPVIIDGKEYNRIKERQLLLDKKVTDTLQTIPLVGNNENLQIQIKQTVPFELWMEQAKLMATVSLEACDHEKVLYTQTLAGILYLPQGPGPVLVKYIEKEVMKKEEGFAQFYYPVNISYVDPALRDNGSQLNKIDKLVHKVLNDTSMHLNKIIITGISSPEGPWNYNARLAQKRAEYMRHYLVSNFAINNNQIDVKYIPEDWDGLRKLVSASTVPDKNNILNILDGNDDNDEKEALLLRQPQYTYIKNNLYPQLRKVTYEIFYTIKEKEEVVVPE